MKNIGDVHAGPVACGRIGSKSGFSAIGADKSVSVYPLSGPGRFSRIAHLTDHPTHVETVCWGDPHSDQRLVAGCSGGSVWLWDIATETQVSTFGGHRANCVASAYHPFGNFFATASVDTNIKIWDARSAKCIQTYRSHASGVSSITFSPHGRWLASGDVEGVIRLFDLSSGKELCCLESHTMGVTCVDFHPTDFFFISSSLDRTIKLWTCDGTFSLAATSEAENVPVKLVKFNQRGNGMCIATNEGIKQFELNHDSKRIACLSSDLPGWEDILDISVQDSIVCLGTRGDKVSVWSSCQDPERPQRRLESRKENFDLDNTVASTPSAQLTGDGIKHVLSKRLDQSRAVCGLWTSGNVKLAVEEALNSTDPGIFVSLINFLGSDRSRISISIDTCIMILSRITEKRLLTGTKAEFFECLPFSKTPGTELSFVSGVSLAACLNLIRRFGSAGIARPEFVNILRDVQETIQSDLRNSKILRKEKEELLTEITALIQS